MCFSPAGDLIGGIAVVAIGVDACRHLKGRSEYLAIAALPVVLGLHQIDETFVWWSLQGHVSLIVGRVAMWIYLLFALVVLPTLVPLLVYFVERTRARRQRIVPFIVVGAVVSVVLFEALLVGHPFAHLGAWHLAYSIGLQHGLVVIGLYILATCGALLASGYRNIIGLGILNLVAVAVLARESADGFASLWCFYAAIVSGFIALYLRGSQVRARRLKTPSESVLLADVQMNVNGQDK